MLKMIVTDIDGTLVEAGQNHIPEGYYEIIREFTDRGIKFVTASGRHISSVKQAFCPVMDCLSTMTQNGAVIQMNGENRVLKPIPMEWVREFWQDLSQYSKADGVACTARRCYCPHAGTKMHGILTGVYQYDTMATGSWNQLPEEPVSMLTIYHPEDAESFCKKHIQEKWSDRLDIYSTGQTWVDLLMPGVNKGTAMKVLCQEYDILPQETISFGDNMNDIPMITLAGTGYAVDTARAEVQAAADRVIPGFRTNGVLQELRNILKQIDQTCRS